MARGRAPAGQEGHDGGEYHWRHGRIGPQDEDPGRPEHGIANQTADRRVETGDGGQPGKFGVGHALRNEDGGQDNAGHDVRRAGPLVSSSRPGPG